MLVDHSQFIIYKLSPKPNGKMDKLPIAGSAHDPSTWLSYADAKTQLDTLGDGHGVGFVLTDNDPYWFLDIDNCAESGQWSSLALDMCGRFAGAFVEVSQSGTGLHIIGSGTVPDHKCRRDDLGLEFYTSGRFIALTWSGAQGNEDTDHSAAVARLVDEYFKPDERVNPANWTDLPRHDWSGPTDDDDLIKRMLATKSVAGAFSNKASLADLWNRNIDKLADCWPDTERDQGYDGSSVDMALAQHLAFWTGCDCERMLRLMWRSELVRDKWTKHKSYLKNTILAAVGRQRDVLVSRQTVTIDHWFDRARSEGADPSTARTLMSDIRNASELTRADKEMIIATLHDTMKTAGVDVKKSTIERECITTEQQVDSVISFPDLKGNGKPKATLENYQALLDHYRVTLRYNLMSKEIEAVLPDTNYTFDNALNCALADIQSLCARHDLITSVVDSFSGRIADTNAYNPVADWINGVTWDGVDRIPTLAATLDAADPDLTLILLRRWLITAIAAVYNPHGVAATGMLVLQGSQYIGKTRWFLRLLDSNRDWCKEAAILNPSDKDSVKQCVSRWLVELGELDATFRKSDIAALKGFITNQEDELRRPYARTESKFPRRTVYFGSVNPKHYLHDETGNRRFWTVQCGENMNADHDVDMRQVWAQCKHLWSQGEQHYLTREENERLNNYNEKFEATNPLDEKLATVYDVKSSVRSRAMTSTEILEELGYDKPTKTLIRDLAGALNRVLKADERRSGGQRVYDMPRRRLDAAFNASP